MDGRKEWDGRDAATLAMEFNRLPFPEGHSPEVDANLSGAGLVTGRERELAIGSPSVRYKIYKCIWKKEN